MEKQDESVQGTQAWGKPAPAALPSPDDATIEQKAARLEQLTQGQLYLSKEEVFAQDIIEEAFVSTDGVDLRNSLAIKNLETATLLSNWLDTDTLIRALFSYDRNFAAKLRGLNALPEQDVAALEGIQARLAAENPQPRTQAEALARYNSTVEVPDTLGMAPANLWLDQRSQFAVRLSWIIHAARTASLQNNDLRQLALSAAREKEPKLTAAEFGTRIGIGMAGISGVRRRVAGISGGNFFRNIGRGISRFFKNPLGALRRMGIEIGKGLILLDKPFQYVRDKVPMFGYVLGGVATAIIAEAGRSLVSGSISSFKEQRIVHIVGTHLTQAGMLLTLVGGVIAVIPCGICQGVGGALVLVGTLAIIVGRAILQVQALMVMQRENREAYLARMRELERLRKLKAAQGEEIVFDQPAPAARSNTLTFAAAALVALVLLR